MILIDNYLTTSFPFTIEDTDILLLKPQLLQKGIFGVLNKE